PLTSVPKKETPMPSSYCVIPGHPHHASGCLIDDPHAAPPPPPPPTPSNGVAASAFPAVLMPALLALEGTFAVPNSALVRRQRCLDHARSLLTLPDRESLVAAALYRAYMRGAPGGSR